MQFFNLLRLDLASIFGAIVLFLFAMCFGATWNDDSWWAYNLMSSLVACTLVFGFSNKDHLSRWPEMFVLLTFCIEFGRLISCFAGTAAYPFLSSRFDDLDHGDDGAFSVVIRAFVLILILGTILVSTGRCRLQFSMRWMIKCLIAIAIVIGILRVSRNSLWLSHNINELKQASLPYVLMITADLTRILIASMISLRILSVGNARNWNAIVLLAILFAAIESFDWYVFMKFIESEIVNVGVELATRLQWKNTYERLQSRLIEITIVSLFTLLLATNNRSRKPHE